MTYDDEPTPREKKISRALAGGLHAVFLVLLIFGVSWQKRYSQPSAVVDLWSTLTPPRQETPPKHAPRIEPQPRPAPKPEVKPVPKPDIALREKLEKERKVRDQQELEKKKEDEAKRRKAQQQELETKKKEEEKRKLETERLAQEAEAKRLAQDKQQIANQLAAAQNKLYEKYVALIQSRIRSLIVEPPNLQGNPQVEFDVVMIPGGEVLNTKMTRSSGVAAYDSAVERAILKASPLPVPPDPALFQQFRELHLKIRPKE